MVFLGFISLLIQTFSLPSYASFVTLPLDLKDLSQTPANNLIDQGQLIDSARAYALKKAGSDISKIDVAPDLLYLGKKLPVHPYPDLNLEYPSPTDGGKFLYYQDSPTELFQVAVDAYSPAKKSIQKFKLSASLFNHSVIINAILLRQLGYDVDVPKYYPSYKVKFENSNQIDDFLNLLGQKTLLSYDDWVIERGENFVILKGVILENYKMRNINIYWPYMAAEKQKTRRHFRGLILPFSLTNFGQFINEISWTDGKVFNEKFLINHTQAEEFPNTTTDDFLWMLRKFFKLQTSDFDAALEKSGYPNDIAQLIKQIILHRLNHYAKTFNLDKEIGFKLFSPIDTQLTLGNVKKGKLQKADFSAYPSEFYSEDELSPYRFSELFKFFRTQAIYNAFAGGINFLNDKYFPQQTQTESLVELNEKLIEYRKENGETNGVLPLNLWAKEIFGGRVFSSRNIVFGQYYSVDSPIQLVDSIGGEISLGGIILTNPEARKKLPISVEVSLSRSYSNVKPIEDISKATKIPVKEILVPLSMRNLGKMLNNENRCNIPEGVFEERIQIEEEEFIQISYDEKVEGSKDNAYKLKDKRVAEGFPIDNFIIKPFDREKACDEVLVKKRDEMLNKFVDSLSANETFIINDQFKFSPKINLTAPIPQAPGASIGLLNEASYYRARTYIIRKGSNYLEITIQTRKDLENFTEGSGNFYLRILAAGVKFTKGDMDSKIYKIPLEYSDEEEKIKGIRILREIFFRNSYKQLKKNFKPKEVDHDLLARLLNFKFLFWSFEKFKMNHHLEISDQNFPNDTRKFFSVMNLKRTGSDVFNFIDRAVKFFTKFIGVGTSTADPGDNILGNSSRFYVLTESETTPNQEPAYMGRIEFIKTGWKAKEKKVKSLITNIDQLFLGIPNYQPIDSSYFFDTDKLMSYDFRTTIILYPQFFEKLIKPLTSYSRQQLQNQLKIWYGISNWQTACERYEDMGMTSSNSGDEKCIPLPVSEFIYQIGQIKKINSEERIKLTKTYNRLLSIIFEHFSTAQTLLDAGPESYLASTRITGFRDGDDEGYLDYVSSSLGQYNRIYGTGILDSVGRQLGINSFELRATAYTPGMF